MSSAFDLGAYLARIALKSAPAADADGLAAVQLAHRLTIPFENLDIRLGRGISLDTAHLFDKIVHRRRGGYCFEQNALFLHALEALGFDARPLLARVWLFAEGVPPRTHMLNLVRIGGEDWIADAGFGGGYAPPMKLAEGSSATTADGGQFRLSRLDGHGWLLERKGDAGAGEWQRQYSFTLDPVFPVDLEMSNHWAATRPGTYFTTQSVVSICLPTGFASLIDRRYNRRAGEQSVETDIESAKAYRLRLNFVFGIVVDEVEVMGLALY